MNGGWRRRLQAGLGWLLPPLGLWHHGADAATPPDEAARTADRPTPLVLDNPWERRELQRFAAHRSHSSHRSHYSSRGGGGGYYYPPPTSVPTYRPPRTTPAYVPPPAPPEPAPAAPPSRAPTYAPPPAYTPPRARVPTYVPPETPPGDLRWEGDEATYRIAPDSGDGPAAGDPRSGGTGGGSTTYNGGRMGLDATAPGSVPPGSTPLGPPSEGSPAPDQPHAPTAKPAKPTATELARMVCNVQMALLARGYEPGPVDCRLGGRTREALMLYQSEGNLPPTGRLDARTLASLGIIG